MRLQHSWRDKANQNEINEPTRGHGKLLRVKIGDSSHQYVLTIYCTSNCGLLWTSYCATGCRNGSESHSNLPCPMALNPGVLVTPPHRVPHFLPLLHTPKISMMKGFFSVHWLISLLLLANIIQRQLQKFPLSSRSKFAESKAAALEPDSYSWICSRMLLYKCSSYLRNHIYSNGYRASYSVLHLTWKMSFESKAKLG